MKGFKSSFIKLQKMGEKIQAKMDFLNWVGDIQNDTFCICQ
jgi:hypothetical protein